MHFRRVILVAAGAFLVVTGAAVGQSSGASTVPLGRWIASFKPGLATNSSISGSGTIRASGGVTISKSENGREGVFKVDIRFSLPNVGRGTTLFWGVVPGRCGSGGIPVTMPSQNPTLDLGASGAAELSNEVALNLRPAEGYHINVYNAALGDRDEAIISCSDLKYVTK